MTETLQIVVGKKGKIRFIHDDDLAAAMAPIGKATTQRASHVEPDTNGKWKVDLSPVGGPVLKGFTRRDHASNAEVKWLKRHQTPQPLCIIGKQYGYKSSVLRAIRNFCKRFHKNPDDFWPNQIDEGCWEIDGV